MGEPNEYFGELVIPPSFTSVLDFYSKTLDMLRELYVDHGDIHSEDYKNAILHCQDDVKEILIKIKRNNNVNTGNN